jgi:hypothetical protein
MDSWAEYYKTFSSVIYEYLQKARVFVIIVLECLPKKSTLAYYENS